MSALTKMILAQEAEKVMPGSGDIIGAALMRSRRPQVSGGVAPEGDIQQYARQKARQMFGRGHFPELKELWNRESGWNPQADNPTSSAYGIPQALTELHDLPRGYMKNPYKQVNWGLNYIADRYRNPTRALGFHDRNNYY